MRESPALLRTAMTAAVQARKHRRRDSGLVGKREINYVKPLVLHRKHRDGESTPHEGSHSRRAPQPLGCAKPAAPGRERSRCPLSPRGAGGSGAGPGPPGGDAPSAPPGRRRRCLPHWLGAGAPPPPAPLPSARPGPRSAGTTGLTAGQRPRPAGRGVGPGPTPSRAPQPAPAVSPGVPVSLPRGEVWPAPPVRPGAARAGTKGTH